jgi:hypothetical protein
MAKQAKTARPVGLRIRKLADRSSGSRETRYDPTTGQKYLHNPATGGAEPWPLAGIQLDGADGSEGPPQTIGISTTVVDNGRAEGWITVEGENVVHRPGGPPGNLWAVTHTFRQVDTLIFHTVDGDVRYRVTHQPDKYAVVDRVTANDDKRLVREEIDPDAEVTDEIYAAGDTRVDWFYVAELEG